MSILCKSRIRGAFRGWDGHSIYQLDNGQIWQQDRYMYTYHYAYRPEAQIVDNGSGYEMQVDGCSNNAHVKRIK